MKNRTLINLLALSTLLLCSCDSKQVTSYHTPADQTSEMLVQQASRYNQPQWETPQHWLEQPLGKLRKGCWHVQDQDGNQAEMTVLVFPDSVGGDLANVNRWAQQINMQSIDSAQLEALSEELEVDTYTGRFVILEDNEHPQAILAAIVPTEQGTWFFKMMGDHDLVVHEQAPFRTFLRTVEFTQ